MSLGEGKGGIPRADPKEGSRGCSSGEGRSCVRTVLQGDRVALFAGRWRVHDVPVAWFFGNVSDGVCSRGGRGGWRNANVIHSIKVEIEKRRKDDDSAMTHGYGDSCDMIWWYHRSPPDQTNNNAPNALCQMGVRRWARYFEIL